MTFLLYGLALGDAGVVTTFSATTPDFDSALALDNYRQPSSSQGRGWSSSNSGR